MQLPPSQQHEVRVVQRPVVQQHAGHKTLVQLNKVLMRLAKEEKSNPNAEVKIIIQQMTTMRDKLLQALGLVDKGVIPPSSRNDHKVEKGVIPPAGGNAQYVREKGVIPPSSGQKVTEKGVIPPSGSSYKTEKGVIPPAGSQKLADKGVIPPSDYKVAEKGVIPPSTREKGVIPPSGDHIVRKGPPGGLGG